MMATEVQSGDLNNGNSSRLEVSIDGLTLSPDSGDGDGDGEPGRAGESEPAAAAGPEAAAAEGEAGAAEDGQDGEADASNMEKKWGFDLHELYGMALKFFKGISCLIMHS